MFAIEVVWDRECNPENQFLISAVENGRLFPLWKVSLGSEQVFMSYYLFIFSSHQRVQHMT